jgi:mannose-6-phosphate isomerase
MANSDNVLRGGLTPKNIDVPELLKILDFSVSERCVLNPKRRMNGERRYQSPAEEFVLSAICLKEGTVFLGPKERSVEVMICTEGKAQIIDLERQEPFLLNRGTAILIPASIGPYRMEGECTVFKASVPFS